MNDKNKAKRQKTKDANDLNSFTYNFIDENNIETENKRKSEQAESKNEATNKNRNKKPKPNAIFDKPLNATPLASAASSTNGNKAQDIAPLMNTNNNTADSSKQGLHNNIASSTFTADIPQDSSNNPSIENSATNKEDTNSSFSSNNEHLNDIVTIENRQTPFFSYFFTNSQNDEIRINSMRNNNDIRITRQEFNINRISEVNNNENLDGFFRMQFSFLYPNLNRQFLYDVYIENNENDINIISETNNINVINEISHENDSLFTGRLNESFNTLFTLFQNVMYKNKTKTLTKDELNKLKVLKYEQKNEKEECSVCMEYFRKNQNIRLLDCTHFFHTKCVDKWFLNESNQCPICRKEV